MTNLLLLNILAILGLAGFALSFFIYSKKKKKKKLICPRYSNCDAVIHSDHSKIFGIPVEILGILYYALIGLSYSLLPAIGFSSATLGMVLLGVSACAFLFSIYLVLLQAFVVRHWCFWCLSSAAISTAIFILSYIHSIH